MVVWRMHVCVVEQEMEDPIVYRDTHTHDVA